MKKLLLILIVSFAFIGCGPDYEYRYKITYTNGESEVITTKRHSVYIGSDGDDCIHGCERYNKRCGVRKIQQISKRIIEDVQ